MATYWGNSSQFVLRCVFMVWCLIFNLVFSHLGSLKWESFFLIAPFPEFAYLYLFIGTGKCSKLSIKYEGFVLCQMRVNSKYVNHSHKLHFVMDAVIRRFDIKY